MRGVYGDAPVNLDSERAAFAVMQCAGVLIDAAVRVRDVACLWLAVAWLSDVLDSYLLEEKPNAVSESLYFRGNARVAIADQHTDEKMMAVTREQWPLERALARWEMPRCYERDVLTSRGARS